MAILGAVGCGGGTTYDEVSPANIASTALVTVPTTPGDGPQMTNSAIPGLVIADPVVAVDGADPTKSFVSVKMLTLGKVLEQTTASVATADIAKLTANLAKGNLVSYVPANLKTGEGVIVPADPSKTFYKVLAKGSGASAVNAVQFDAMKDGAELQAIDGVPGKMVAAGWIFAKDNKTITIGDDYEEMYQLANDIAVYEVNTADYGSSKVSTLADVPVIKDRATTKRQAVYAVFDKNSRNVPSAKVIALYFFTPQAGEMPVNTITVNGVQRTYRYYLPSNIEYLKVFDRKDIRVVISFHDQGQNGQVNANETRWHEVAEANGFVVIYPDAVNGTWNTTASVSGNDEAAFVYAAWTDVRNKYQVSDACSVYLTGIGTGASLAHQLSMMLTYAGNLGGIPVIAAVAGIRGVADPAIFDLPKMSISFPSTPGAYSISASTPAGRSLSPTTISAWLLSDAGAAVAQQADYWKTANTVAASPTTTSDSYFDTVIYSNASNKYHEVRLSTFKTPAVSGKTLSHYLWDNMFKRAIRFKDDDRINGSIHRWETIAEMGMTDTTRAFSAAAGGARRFITYVPTSYANGSGSVPLVISIHGSNGSGRWQATTSQWHKTAEKYGFIAVFPYGLNANFTSSITPGAPNYDVQYIVELMEYFKTQYRVDSKRIFINGNSLGSSMTNRVIVERPELFAAAAPCYSGSFSASVYTNYQQYPQIRTDVPIPVWQCRGGSEPPSAFPAGEAGQEAARHFWRVVVNGYPDVGGAEDNEIPTSIATFGPEARKHLRIWSGGKAKYVWQVTDYMPHFWHPDNTDLIWTEMFSKYQRNADGSLTYTP